MSHAMHSTAPSQRAAAQGPHVDGGTWSRLARRRYAPQPIAPVPEHAAADVQPEHRWTRACATALAVAWTLAGAAVIALWLST